MNSSIDTAPIGTSSETYTTSSLGIFVNIELPVFFRLWGTYYLTHKYENSSSEDFNGDGYGLGIGITTFPFITINFEAKYLNFSEIDSITGTVKLPTDTRSSDDVKEFVLSVSMPMVM